MYPSYDDIKRRIPEPPVWYDAHGVPRYDPPEEHLLPFMRWVQCQDCEAKFWVCLVGEVYHTLYDAGFQVELTKLCPHELGEFHARGMVRHMRTIDPETREWVNLPLPDNWHYGDPPSHDCIGDTMSSIPDYEWEEWEKEREAQDETV